MKVQKSIRLEESVVNFINSYHTGENFSEKLENMIKFAFYNENELKQKITSLESDIEKSYKILTDLDEISSAILVLQGTLDLANNNISKLYAESRNVLRRCCND